LDANLPHDSVGDRTNAKDLDHDAAFKEWTVLPHGKLSQIDDNILTVVGKIHMPLMDLPRRMTVVRLADSRLVVFSAIALDEDEMAALEAHGHPAYLIVPATSIGSTRRSGKTATRRCWSSRPKAREPKVEEIVPVDTVAPRFDDANVEFVTVPGTRGHEAALVVRTPNGTTLVLNDIVGNIRDESGFTGWLLHVVGVCRQGGANPQGREDGDDRGYERAARSACCNGQRSIRSSAFSWRTVRRSRATRARHCAISQGSLH
jgi:hypothetical protein